MTFVSHLENIVFEEFSSNDNILKGEVISVKDGVAFVPGLPNRRKVQFSGYDVAFVTNLYDKIVQFLNKVFGNDQEITQDNCVLALERLVDAGVGEELLGSVSFSNFDLNQNYNRIYKTKTYLSKKISYNNIHKRGMRKAAQNTSLTISQKQGISSFLFSFIDKVINKTNKKEELLPNLIDYMKDNSLGEFVLKQTISKGFLPKFTFKKKEALPFVDTSNKLAIINPMEKADIRFLPEAIIANQFAEQQENIQQISFNSENPSEIIAKSSYGGGNYVKDLFLQIKSNSKESFNFELDVKTGNNAYNNPNFILGPLPILPEGNVYSVVCNIPEFSHLVELRLKFFRDLKSNGIISKNALESLEMLTQVSIDNLKRNILIQDELLKIISTGVIKKNPSFYSAFKVIKHEVEINFYKKMEPYINVNNFNSKKDFEIFARYGLKAFYESVIEARRSKIFDKSLFKDTGFDQIDLEGLF